MMKNIFICLLLSLLVLSCNNPSDPEEVNISKYKGDWYPIENGAPAARAIITINDDASITVYGESPNDLKNIPASDVKKNSDNNYSFTTQGTQGSTSVTLVFNSDSSGTFSYNSNGVSDSTAIVKK